MMRRARRNQGTLDGVYKRVPAGRATSSSCVTEGCACGESRKYQAQTAIHTRLTPARMKNDCRQDHHAIRAATMGGVMKLPSRAELCVIPCAKPQRDSGAQRDIACVAVGSAEPPP